MRRRSPHSLPKHTWRQEDRLLLSLLDLCFANHIREFTYIFNDMNSKVLVQEGFQEGMPVGSLSAQLYEMRNRGTGSKLFSAVSTLSLGQLNGKFAAQLDQIRTTANELDIDLVPKQLPEERKSRPLTSLRVQKRSKAITTTTTETIVTAWEPDLVDEDDFHTPTKSRKPKPNTIPCPKPSLTSVNAPRYFLYRAFEVVNGLKARRFVDGGAIPNPPHPKSRDFEAEVRLHLARNMNYNSPFMSLTQIPSVAMKHAYERTAQGVPMAFAIFKYDDLIQDALQHYDSGSGPHLVPKICENFDMYDLPGGFTGFGEWLVWGSIQCSPVAIIQPAETIMLRAMFRVLKQTRAFDYAAGQRMRRFLPHMDIPTHAEQFLYELSKGFRITGHKALRTSNKWHEFVRGATEIRLQPRAVPIIVLQDQNESDSDSDVMILEVRPCAAPRRQQNCTAKRKRTGFPRSDWRSDTTSLMDWQTV